MTLPGTFRSRDLLSSITGDALAHTFIGRAEDRARCQHDMAPWPRWRDHFEAMVTLIGRAVLPAVRPPPLRTAGHVQCVVVLIDAGTNLNARWG